MACVCAGGMCDACALLLLGADDDRGYESRWRGRKTEAFDIGCDFEPEESEETYQRCSIQMSA